VRGTDVLYDSRSIGEGDVHRMSVKRYVVSWEHNFDKLHSVFAGRRCS